MEILKVNNLRTYFETPHGVVRAVDGIGFSLRQGETLGIVGESGAGKSVTALTVMGLAWQIGARLVRGEVWYAGTELLASPGRYQGVRGRKISMIPQEAAASINPVLTVAQQIGELLKVHLGLTAVERRIKICELLERVEISDPELVGRQYPSQLSGGIIQRVLLAMALSCGPDIIIADEPASSLDVSVQSEILKLLDYTKKNSGLALVLIAHDLAVICNNSDRIMVMFQGCVMESGPTKIVLSSPLHPYTVSLLSLYRNLDQVTGDYSGLAGSLSNSSRDNTGCRYAPRCSRVTGNCLHTRPEPAEVSGDRVVACHNPIV